LRIGFTNLVGDPNLPTELAKRKTQWHFSPPSAPHFGGVWERLVQSNKRAIKTILNEQAVSDEVLVIAFTEVSALLNGRPFMHNPPRSNRSCWAPLDCCGPDCCPQNEICGNRGRGQVWTTKGVAAVL
jgi:hypothetical protein